MLCLAECSNRNFRICRTGILWHSLAIIYPMDIHFGTAVCTIHQTCQRVGFSPSIWISSHIASDSLHIVKSFLIYDCFLSVLKHRPVILRYIMAFLILEMLSGLEVHCVTKIFSFLQNTCNSRRAPAIRIFDFFYSAFP